MAEKYWVGDVIYTTFVKITAEHMCSTEEEAIQWANDNRDFCAETETEADGRMEPHEDDPSDNEEWKMRGEPHERP